MKALTLWQPYASLVAGVRDHFSEAGKMVEGDAA